ncbi:MAG: hypothetical protein ACFFD2_14450 [Promethearchaeota archaeon]
MQHFLTKIIQGNTEENIESIHRRFVKFSKGAFPNGGPVVKVKVTKKNNLTINGSFEYEDLIGYFVATNLPNVPCRIGGNIYTQPRVTLNSIQKTINTLSLGDRWVQGKRDLKNLFIRPMNLTLLSNKLIDIYDKLAEECFLLLTITPSSGKEWIFKSDEKIPPLKKTFGKADPFTTCKPESKLKCKVSELCQKSGICIRDRIKFCRAKTGPLKEYTEFFEFFLPDFPDLPTSFTDLLIINKYTITDFILPEDKDSLSSKELREKIKKVGNIERIVYIDNKLYSNKVGFTI